MIGRGPSARVAVRAGATTEAPDLVVGPLDVPSVDVLVTDGDGRPVPRARVGFAQAGGGTNTGAEGRARVYAVADHGAGPPPLRVWVRAQGFAPQVTGVVEPAAVPPELRVVLRRGLSVEGRVVWRDGTPAAGADVWVFNGEADPEKLASGNPYAAYPHLSSLPLLTYYNQGRSGADGSFEVGGLPEGTCHVQVSGGPWLRDVPAGARGLLVELPADPPAPGVTLEGTAADAATGKPLVRFDAAVYDKSRRVEAVHPTLGAFRIEGVPPGAWTLQVRAEGYATHEERIEVDAAGSPNPFPILLRRGVTVRGRIRNESQVDFASVSFVDEHYDFAGGATLDADGSFRAPALLPGRYRPVAWPRGTSVPKPHFGIGTLVVAETDAERTFDFVLRPCGTLLVEIRLARPEPYPDGTLRVEDERGDTFLEFRGPRAVYGGEWRLPLGRYRLTLFCPGHAPQARDVEVRAESNAVARFGLP
jgi:hypothetical protein